MNISLTPEERKEFIDKARAEFVAAMIAEAMDDFDLISISQAAGMLDMHINTLAKVKGFIRIEIIPGKVIKYRRSQIVAALKTMEEEQ